MIFFTFKRMYGNKFCNTQRLQGKAESKKQLRVEEPIWACGPRNPSGWSLKFPLIRPAQHRVLHFAREST